MSVASPSAITKIGLATSTDGVNWTRANGGNPIISPRQPGLGGTHTSNRFFVNHGNGYSSDMQYVDATDQFAMVDAPSANQIRIMLYNSQLSRKEGEVFINLVASWFEGPGIVSTLDRHAVAMTSCGVIPLDIMRAVGPGSGGGWETLAGDFDGDGWADYADRHIASGQVWVHRNNHVGGFDGSTWAFGYTATGPNMEVLVGDLSGDGKADLIEHNRKTGQFWVRVTSGGTFVPQDVGITFRSQAGSTGSEWRAVIADFNGDGTVDAADLHVPSFQFWVHPAIGWYQFNASAWNPVQAFVWSGFTPIFGDFDGDNWADYADVNRDSGEIWVHRSQQNTTFDQVNTWEYGVFSPGSGGRWILGMPVSFP